VDVINQKLSSSLSQTKANLLFDSPDFCYLVGNHGAHNFGQFAMSWNLAITIWVIVPDQDRVSDALY